MTIEEFNAYCQSIEALGISVDHGDFTSRVVTASLHALNGQKYKFRFVADIHIDASEIMNSVVFEVAKQARAQGANDLRSQLRDLLQVPSSGV